MEEVEEVPESSVELEDDLDLDSAQNQCSNVVSQDINSPCGSDRSNNELEKDFCSHETEEQVSGKVQHSNPVLWPR